MSTKIYNAVRFPADKLNNFLDWSRGRMLRSVKERLESLMEGVKPEALGKCPPHFRKKGGKAVWERHARMKIVMAECRRAAQTTLRDPIFDIECGFNLWLHNGYFYAIPIAEPWIIKSIETRRPRWVEEYHYQNQTDQPRDISDKEWNQRRRNWEKVCLNDHNARRMYHAVVECKTELESFDLEWELATQAVHKWRDKNLEKPRRRS